MRSQCSSQLRHSLTQPKVQAADDMGWAGLENGDLLKAAEANRFEGRDLTLIVPQYELLACAEKEYWPGCEGG